jgi:hypothetical protein
MKSQKIQDASLCGWWDDEPAISVAGSGGATSGIDEVKATAFVQSDGGGGLIALGNFGNASRTIVLAGDILIGKILVADSIQAFQPAQSFAEGSAIVVAGKRGWLLRIATNATTHP